VIFAKYQAYLDRQNKSKNRNNIASEESILINKTPNRFAGLKHPWNSVATPTFIFLLLICLHGVFFLKQLK
jgi:hypothetical protein